MNIFQRIIRKKRFLLNKFYLHKYTKVLYNEVINDNSEKNIYLFSNPSHSNLGDQAQTYCILRWFSSYYQDYKVICVPKLLATQKLMDYIQNKVRVTDKIFVHSGYLLYDPHPELPFIKEVVSRFQNNKIVVLPQTVNLKNEEVRKEISTIFNSHPSLTLMCRDEISYRNASELFTCKLLLRPDFVTSIIGESEFNFENQRNGVLFVLRNDGEKFYSDIDLNKLKSRFMNMPTKMIDTTIEKSFKDWYYHRERIVKKYIELFSHYQVVITDRYHGTIFSAVASTPVVVLSSADHKLSSGVKWFPQDVFKNNVQYAKNLDEAYEMAKSILDSKDHYKNPPYFTEKYFNKSLE